MYSAGILGQNSARLLREVETRLNRAALSSVSLHLLTAARHLSAALNVVALLDGAQTAPHQFCLAPGGILLVPDGLSPGAFSAAYIVSYGPSRKDTLTISSTEGQETVLALQREIVTLSGALLEPQEIPFRGSGQLSSLEQVALAGILLALGVPPENLGV